VNATAFVGQLDRLPLPVKSHPGFLINRILMPYLIESVFLLEDGVPASVIDAAARDFGMPLGPVELADTVGLDICYSVACILSEQFGTAVPTSLEKMIESGFLGRKSGRGFYKYNQQGKLISDGARKDPSRFREINDRLILALLNEAVACLSEGIVEDDDLLDAGMIFGTGFAPFRGGPIQYAYDRGIADVTGTLMQLQNQFGNRFEPHSGWAQLQAEQPEEQGFVEENLPEESEDQAI
jgi:3-hydroxyacyl-CoA dehydrogenase/enoyl-CoA hydratase/3-hydroxybutyryl-CoA epimerase